MTVWTLPLVKTQMVASPVCVHLGTEEMVERVEPVVKVLHEVSDILISTVETEKPIALRLVFVIISCRYRRVCRRHR